MPRPTQEQRAEAKFRCEAGESYHSVARLLKIRRQTIMLWADKEHWIIPVRTTEPENELVRQEIKEQVRSSVIDISTRKAVEQIASTGALDDMILDLTSDVRMTSRLGQSVDKTIDRFLEGKILPGKMQNEADVLKSVIIAAKSYAELRRTMAGKGSGDASIDLGPKVDTNITLNVRRLPAKREDAKSA